MPRSYPSGPRSRSPFVVTSYVPDSAGHLVAEMPAFCPMSASTEPGCRLSIHHRRLRKTGPRHPLTVVECHTHGCGFTLYPAGYAPYRRQPVLQLAPDGGPILDGGERGEFADTLFHAAIDAQAGRPWARSTGDDLLPDRWWGTQGRHLEVAARLVGVVHDLEDPVREAIAATLSVSAMVLRDLSRTSSYRAIGDAVCSVLQRLRGGARRAHQLLVCGHLVGHWAPPLQWDARRQVMERSPFLCLGTTSGSSP